MNDMGVKARTLTRAMIRWHAALMKATSRNRDKPWRVPMIILLSHGSPIFMDKFGRWESTSGKKVRFYCSTRIFLSKLKIEEEGSASFGLGSMKATVKKNKLNPAGHIAAFQMALKDLQKPKLSAGQIDNVKNIVKDIKDWDILVKNKKSVSIFGEEYRIQKDFVTKMYEDPAFRADIWNKMTRVIATGQVEMDVDSNELLTEDELEMIQKKNADEDVFDLNELKNDG